MGTSSSAASSLSACVGIHRFTDAPLLRTSYCRWHLMCLQGHRRAAKFPIHLSKSSPRMPGGLPTLCGVSMPFLPLPIRTERRFRYTTCQPRRRSPPHATLTLRASLCVCCPGTPHGRSNSAGGGRFRREGSSTLSVYLYDLVVGNRRTLSAWRMVAAVPSIFLRARRSLSSSTVMLLV